MFIETDGREQSKYLDFAEFREGFALLGGEATTDTAFGDADGLRTEVAWKRTRIR